MENYVVSARKYRPTVFDTVVGQSSITNTLKNAIESGKLAQAFLFCGPRGVGKTTCARILAKTINCENKTSEIEACGKCTSCASFDEGRSLNILELDAASNNSVDDIRNLIDQVRFAPQYGDYKVYIIDEVHMLSPSAFNSFLKTLEEPPPHAIFILATTEKHKIIPTILSRCQIFDFQRIQINDIANHLSKIAEKENIQTEMDGLHIIAQKADGALRDALSMFDQLVTFSGGHITYDGVIENLNILDYDYYFKLTDEILQNAIHPALLTFNEIVNKGFNGHNFLVGIAEHFRNLLVCKDQNTVVLLEVGDNIKQKYLEQSIKCDQKLILSALEIANKADVNYKSAKNQRLHVELCVMQLCSVNSVEKKTLSVALSAFILPPPTKHPSDNQHNTVVNKKANTTELQPIKTAAGGLPSYIGQSPHPKVEQNRPKVKLNKARLGSNSISIQQTLNPVAKQQKDTVITAYEDLSSRDPFTDDAFMELWNAYADKALAMSKSSLRSILQKRKPVISADFSFEIVVDNSMQEDELIRERGDFLLYLKKGLNNFGIRMDVVVQKKDEKKRVYTSRDKYERMVAKNPLLASLKQKLDLDIDW